MANPDQELLRNLLSQETVSKVPDEKRRWAGDELSSIFALKNSADYQWFVRECLEPRYKEAIDHLVGGADTMLVTHRHEFLAARAARNFLTEREILARKTLNENDPEIARLTEKLTLH